MRFAGVVSVISYAGMAESDEELDNDVLAREGYGAL
jgi:hypothetical protein